MLYEIIFKKVLRFPKNTNFYSEGAKAVMTEQIRESIIKEFKMRLSDQALGAIMMALQKSLVEQSDIVPVLKGLNFQMNEEECLTVINPPTFEVPSAPSTPDEIVETKSTTGSD